MTIPALVDPHLDHRVQTHGALQQARHLVLPLRVEVVRHTRDTVLAHSRGCGVPSREKIVRIYILECFHHLLSVLR